ncbi:mediator of RNA polymerase II transcription subunit 24 [Ischnura elegans]|uniref:mediator of RNA polymerase II transcription subunit 24 n=1 Tax=Ischnura elegans TaxID=197161 RepID=UPI001ED8B1AE|nr:mediator of RNA polymerase II transcription subunit 24 [Ischnura elegans]
MKNLLMGVTMETTKVTSKTSSLKALLLRAWRERWTDLQWGIQIKTILPRGVSGDVYNLADCILQQALVGPGPNELVLTYLKHSLSSQLVSYAAVLQRISKYDGFHKPHCVISLMEFLETIQGRITCRGKPEEGLLAASILSLVHWLLTAATHALTALTDLGDSPEHSLILEKPFTILGSMLNCDFTLAMLQLARQDDRELFNDVLKKCKELEVALSGQGNAGKLTTSMEEILRRITSLDNEDGCLKGWMLQPISQLSQGAQGQRWRQKKSGVSGDKESSGEEHPTADPVTYCPLQALLAVEVLLNPSSDTHVFVNDILMMQRLKGYTLPRLYSEVMRACLICLNDVLTTSEESQWGAFTFLKVPHILRQLHMSVSGESASHGKGSPGSPSSTSSVANQDKLNSSTMDGLASSSPLGDPSMSSPSSQSSANMVSATTPFSQDVVNAFELLLQYTPLLDVIDAKCSCSVVECLLNELAKVGLVTETHVKAYSSRREASGGGVQKSESSVVSQTASIPKVIIRAEPTLARILKTLDADYIKIQEALLGVLCQVLTGKSFELILAVATVEGKLRTFVMKLIKFNECSKGISGEGGKAAQTRAMLFDISFLMLCSIVQTYGSQVVLSEEGGDSFFEQWVRECMVERGRPKCPETMLKRCDPSKVDALLSQFNAGDIDFKMGQVKWHEMCLNVPAAIREVLFAWEQGSLSPTDVKRVLDALRSRMCCLPVCAAAWLCSHMQILHQDALLKPMNMVQQFLTTLPNEDIIQQDNFKERSSLMFQIIRKMQYDVHPPTLSKSKVLTLSHCIVSHLPISEQLQTIWGGIHKRGWVTVEATHTLESLLNTGGSQWFVSNLVKEVLKYHYREDLDKAVDLAFAIFHLDIENCNLALLLHVLPQYLQNQMQREQLVEPQATALAQLCAYCVFSAVEAQGGVENTVSSSSSVSGSGNGMNIGGNGRGGSRKRSRRDMEGEDLEGICPSKLLRLAPSLSMNTTPEPNDAAALFGSVVGASSTVGTQRRAWSIPDPLQMALNELFQAFSVIVQDGEVSQQTHFVFKFLECVVKCGGRDRTGIVLQSMPSSLVPSLLRSLPDLFTTDLLLRLHDIRTVSGRRAAARDLCMLRNMTMKPGWP